MDVSGRCKECGALAGCGHCAAKRCDEANCELDEALDLLERIAIKEEDDGWWLVIRGSRCGAVRFDEPKGSICRFALDAFEADRRDILSRLRKGGK
jgi:hypothetical protein